jgi:Uma2 family endonuclease
MSVEILSTYPVTPTSSLGPHRRRDYEALPDEPRCELIYGRFYVSPSALVVHQVLVTLLWSRLNAIGKRVGGLALVAPVDVHLADHSVVQPDVLYVSRERRSIVKARIEGAPDLVVEVASPGTSRRDRGEKLRLYAESGVREYWLVDPAGRQIDFLVARDGVFEVVLPSDDHYRSPGLAELELDLAAFWAEVEAMGLEE